MNPYLLLFGYFLISFLILAFCWYKAGCEHDWDMADNWKFYGVIVAILWIIMVPGIIIFYVLNKVFSLFERLGEVYGCPPWKGPS